MDALIDVDRLARLHDQTVERWHAGPIVNDERDAFYALALTNHAFNFQLWHEEDQARDPAADDAVIARVKHAIDGFNQQRNDAMERIDEWVLATLAARGASPDGTAPLHSETVGAIVDRLSILALKIFHMHEQTLRTDAEPAHIESCRAKLATLREQRADLAGALAGLDADLRVGRKRFKVYRQMKMYNDPTLNPILYGG
ncbi:MAG TPA: DUF4254 domain-containing protein [bacterium]|nr:DUF4254 domain-containing protein [bacterium]